MENSIDINNWKLVAFLSILLIPLAINYRFKLTLGKTISVSVVRMSLQLIMVGLYLVFLFELNSFIINLIWLSVMLLIGSRAVITNAKLKPRYLYPLVISAMTLSLLPILAILLMGLLQPSPSYSAQYLIPLAGMLLGNSLTGNIVALQQFYSSLKDKESEYLAALALGATPKQACLPFIQQALKSALAPILASMATTGVVTLPGMMTGQILGGVAPIIAVKYQLVIMVSVFTMLSLSVALTLSLCVRFTVNQTGLVKNCHQ